jgi:hypothetical protein
MVTSAGGVCGCGDDGGTGYSRGVEQLAIATDGSLRTRCGQGRGVRGAVQNQNLGPGFRLSNRELPTSQRAAMTPP